MRCDYCSSLRGVEKFPSFPIEETVFLCRVCSRLHGTAPYRNVTLADINQNIVTLFHTLDLVPHDTDVEIPNEETD